MNPWIFVTAISIGNNSWIGKESSFYSDGEVIIKYNVDIEPYVVINTSEYEIEDLKRHTVECITMNIKRYRETWISTRGTMIKTHVGNSVVATAVVKKTFK